MLKGIFGIFWLLYYCFLFIAAQSAVDAFGLSPGWSAFMFLLVISQIINLFNSDAKGPNK